MCLVVNFRDYVKCLIFFNVSKLRKKRKIIFFDSFEHFIALYRNHFEIGIDRLTKATYNQMIKKEYLSPTRHWGDL